LQLEPQAEPEIEDEPPLERIAIPLPRFDKEIATGMNALATILRSGDGGREGRLRADMSEVAARLGRLLESFAADEIPPDRDIGISLRDPLLLLLAQHRSF
jgi:hypothetical protein